MESDFQEAWNRYFDRRRPHLTEEQIVEYERYALSNRERAKLFTDFLTANLNLDLFGRRVLDIGSAYAGFVIHCASLGARAYGVETLPELHEMAVANALGEPGFIQLILGDILDPDVLRQIEREPFDLIILNDVFEHVFGVDDLFASMKKLSGPQALVYLTIPNAYSYHAIYREHHKFLFGLSLLDPGYWAEMVGPFNIYHRPWNFYRLYFRSIGFNHLYMKVDRALVPTAPERIERAHADIEQRIETENFKTWEIKQRIKINFKRLKYNYQESLAQGDALLTYLAYEQHAWEGIASKHPLNISDNLLEVTLPF